MNIDSKEEENQGFSEDENQNNKPWQCGLTNPSERILALYENGNFTDITLTFPETEITYEAHRLILAISSPVFEGILYGPMRLEGRNLLLHGDDPLIMEYVIAHCYGEDLEPPDMDTALEVYKLADKYMLDRLKKECCQHIVKQMNSENNDGVIEFVERFSFNDLISNCLPFIKEKFEEVLKFYEKDKSYEEKCYEEETEYISAFRMLMYLNDKWIEGLLSEVRINFLDFRSWKYPNNSQNDNRLRTIISSKGDSLDRFFGCINAEFIHHFPLGHNDDVYTYMFNTVKAFELFVSVTDPHHAKSVIEEMNQQNRFESNFIAIHIRCEEIWPSNWSPIRPERTHRPSVLLISDADDDKASWIVEAAKAFLPQCEGSFNKVFKSTDHCLFSYNFESRWKPVNVLFLPRSCLTPNGFINLLQELSISGVKCNKIIYQSPNISDTRDERFLSTIQNLKHRGFNPRVRNANNDTDTFRNVCLYCIE